MGGKGIGGGRADPLEGLGAQQEGTAALQSLTLLKDLLLVTLRKGPASKVPQDRRAFA